MNIRVARSGDEFGTLFEAPSGSLKASNYDSSMGRV